MTHKVLAVRTTGTLALVMTLALCAATIGIADAADDGFILSTRGFVLDGVGVLLVAELELDPLERGTASYQLDEDEDQPIVSERLSVSWSVSSAAASDGVVFPIVPLQSVYGIEGYGRVLSMSFSQDENLLSRSASDTYFDGWSVTVSENPIALSVISTLPSGFEFNVSRPVDVVAATPSDVASYLRLLMIEIQRGEEWVDTQIVADGVFTAHGVAYIDLLLPGLDALLPTLYQINPVPIDRPSSTNPGDPGITEPATTGVDAGDAIERSFVALGSLTGLPAGTARAVPIIVFALAAAFGTVRITGSSIAAMPVVVLVLLAGGIMGFIPLWVLAALGIVSVIVIAFLLFLRRAS